MWERADRYQGWESSDGSWRNPYDRGIIRNCAAFCHCYAEYAADLYHNLSSRAPSPPSSDAPCRCELLGSFRLGALSPSPRSCLASEGATGGGLVRVVSGLQGGVVSQGGWGRWL